MNLRHYTAAANQPKHITAQCSMLSLCSAAVNFDQIFNDPGDLGPQGRRLQHLGLRAVAQHPPSHLFNTRHPQREYQATLGSSSFRCDS